MVVRQLSTLGLAAASAAAVTLPAALLLGGGSGDFLAAAPQMSHASALDPTASPSPSPQAGGAGKLLIDSDGDLLPDDLERVLMLDPNDPDTDQNGVDDFLHVVQFRHSSARTPRPTDHEMRVVTTLSSTQSDPGNSDPGIWVHLLFRFVGASVQDLTSFEPFLDHWGMRLPLFDLFQHSESQLGTFNHPQEGLYLILSVRTARPDELCYLLPCTIGATATLAGKTVTTGSYLQSLGGQLTTFVATGEDVGVMQSLSGMPIDDPFWTRDRVCLFRLSQVATAPGGVLAEVNAADCIPARNPASCPPTCQGSVGRILYFPDGMRTVTGGGGQ